MPSALDQAFAPLQTALNLRGYRQQLLAANMANANTPHYKAVDLDFSAALRSALQGQAAGLPLKVEQSRQMAAGGASNPAASFVAYQAGNTVRLDGNSVDMDRERASFADNSVKYESTLRFINGSVRTMMDAMKSHNAG